MNLKRSCWNLDHLFFSSWTTVDWWLLEALWQMVNGLD